MDGVRLGARLEGTYATAEAALETANMRQGHEVVVQDDDGQFALHEATITDRAQGRIATGQVRDSDLAANMVAFSLDRNGDGIGGESSLTFDRGLANGQVIPGSEVAGGGARYADTEELIGQISQSDRLPTNSDMNRCGAHAVLSAAIRQGPAAVQGIVDALQGRHSDLRGIDATDSLTPREVGLIAHAMYREAGGRSSGLSAQQLVTLSARTGVAPAAAAERQAHDDLGIGTLADGESRAFLIRMDVPGDTSGKANHWVTLTRRGDEFLAADSGREPHQIAFEDAAAAEDWIAGQLAPNGPNGRATTEVETVRIPPRP